MNFHFIGPKDQRRTGSREGVMLNRSTTYQRDKTNPRLVLLAEAKLSSLIFSARISE
jgi:hypothetical protein